MERPKSLSEKVLIFSSLVVVFGFVLANSYEEPVRVYEYDCEIAEFAPDVPPKVKEECRNLKEIRT